VKLGGKENQRVEGLECPKQRRSQLRNKALSITSPWIQRTVSFKEGDSYIVNDWSRLEGRSSESPPSPS